MRNLLKYEFRKSRTGTLVLLGLLAAIEALFLGLLYLHEEPQISILAVLLLGMYASGASMYVFVHGIVDYSRDLGTRSGWMLFMTPNSARKIIGAKYVYMFLLTVCVTVIIGLVGVLDLRLYATVNPQFVALYHDMLSAVSSIGIQTGNIPPLAVLFVALTGIEVVSTIAVAWFSITLSRTLLRDKGWRWIVSLALFIALMIGLQKFYGHFQIPLDQLTLIDDGAGLTLYNIQAAKQVDAGNVIRQVVLPALLPGAIGSLVVIVAAWLGCAALLEYRIDL